MDSGRKPDYLHDSLCEITLRQAEMIRERDEVIARQGARQMELALQNVALREDAGLFMDEEHQRYSEILILIENWLHAHVAEGHRTVDARALLEVVRDVFEYAEEDKEPAWFEDAVRAMSGAR